MQGCVTFVTQLNSIIKIFLHENVEFWGKLVQVEKYTVDPYITRGLGWLVENPHTTLTPPKLNC